MQIVELIFYPRSNLISIKLNTGQKFSLDAELALEKGIGLGTELDDKRIKELQISSIQKRLKQHAFRYLSIRQRSTFEMETYLKKKAEKLVAIFTKVPETDVAHIISKVVDDLVKRQYLNDAEFGRQFIAQKLEGKAKGKRALAFELTRKGVNKQTIEALLKDEVLISEEKTGTLIDKSIEKIASVVRSRQYDKRKAREILTRRLLSRGFGYDEIRTKIDDWIRSEYNK